MEPSVTVLLVGFVGAGASCLFLGYLNSIAGFTSNDLSVQLLGWMMLAFLLLMACVTILGGLEWKTFEAKGLFKRLESDRETSTP